MEYVFGTVQRGDGIKECLKTVGSEHTDLTGRVVVQRDYPDRKVEDVFTVAEHIDSADDPEGKCYDWYIIDAHNRDTDMFSPVKDEIDGGINDTQDAVCDLSEELEERIATIEDALCELTEV